MSSPTTPEPLHARIAARVQALRAERGLSIQALADRSGVSRSMISLVERGEASPTAVVLERLASGLDVMLSALFEAASASTSAAASPIARRDEQPLWRDPASGYRRRAVSPPQLGQPLQIVEVQLPALAVVGFDHAIRRHRVFQQVWLLEGELEVTLGDTPHRLHEGDCLAMTLDEPVQFRNPTRRAVRYAVVIHETSTTR